MIHDNVCESRKVNSISFEAEALWFRLLTVVDDNGNYYRDVRRVFPNLMIEKSGATERSTEKALAELVDIGLIGEFEADGRKYLHLTDFEKYQDLRQDKNAAVQFPVHPPELGPGYTGPGMRQAVYRPGADDAPPSGRTQAASVPPDRESEVEVEVKEEVKDELNKRANSDFENDEPVEDLGNWPEFVKDFHRAAGGVKTFQKFESNAGKYQELCRRHGSDHVHAVIGEWVVLNGGKRATKKNQFAAKNFLEEAEALIEDRKSGESEPEADEVVRVAGPRGVRPELMR